jgi:transcriptional antiterminator
LHFTWNKIAQMLGVSERNIYDDVGKSLEWMLENKQL